MRFLRTLILLLIFLSPANGKSADDTTRNLLDVFVSPEKELIVIQWKNLNTETLEVSLLNSDGLDVQKTILYAGSTIAYFETQTLYSGEYTIKISNGKETITHKITLAK
jgi:hypothetical protein